MKAYYEILKELRIDHDLTQADVATMLGTTQGYYSKYELGLRELSINRLVTLCLYYGVSADYILGLPQGLHHPR